MKTSSKRIKVAVAPSKYYGHIYEHIERAGIYQIAFKRKPDTRPNVPKLWAEVI